MRQNWIIFPVHSTHKLYRIRSLPGKGGTIMILYCDKINKKIGRFLGMSEILQQNIYFVCHKTYISLTDAISWELRGRQ